MLHDLVQIDGLGEIGKPLRAFRVEAGDAQCGAELKLRDRDAVRAQAGDARLRVLKFHGRVTDVVAHADMPAHRRLGVARRIARQRGEPRRALTAEKAGAEKLDRLLDRLQVAARLGFQRQNDRLPSPFRDPGEVRRMADQVFDDRLDPPRGPRLEGARHRADASCLARW